MQNLSPDDRGVERKGDFLEGLKIDVIVCGGIAAVETPKLLRELRRYGAETRVIMTPSALQFVSAQVFEWASGHSVVSDLSGRAEHISDADLVLVAPATLDFIGKIASGLADSAAATALQSLLGRKPIFFVPSMHDSLWENPLFQKNKTLLSGLNSTYFIDPIRAEGKAKTPDFEDIVAWVCHHSGRASSLRGMRAIVTLGPTRSYLDDVRFLTNFSSGRLGLQIADDLFRLGVSVEAVSGIEISDRPAYLNFCVRETNESMLEEVQTKLQQTRVHLAVLSAAVLDFDVIKPQHGKKSSVESWDLSLKPSKKLIPEIKAPNLTKIGFKLESGIEEKDFEDRVRIWASYHDCRFVIANRLEDISESRHRALLYDSTTSSFQEAQGKNEISLKLIQSLETVFKTGSMHQNQNH